MEKIVSIVGNKDVADVKCHFKTKRLSKRF